MKITNIINNRQSKRRIPIRFFFELENFTLENFIGYCMTLEDNQTYTMIMRIATLELRTAVMAGRNAGLVLEKDVSEETKLFLFKSLYDKFDRQLGVSRNYYKYLGDLSMIEIIVYKINVVEKLKIKDITHYINKYNQKLLEMNQNKKYLTSSFLPLSIDERYYGLFLNINNPAHLEELNKIWSSKQIEDYNNYLMKENQLVISNQNSSIYKYTKYKKNHYIIVQRISKLESIKHIFTEELHEVAQIKDTELTKDLFKRTKASHSIYINSRLSKITKVIRKLKPLKPLLNYDNNPKNKNKKRDLDRDTRFGTFDIETFRDSNISKVYSLGYKIFKKEVDLYYITDITSEELEYYKQAYGLIDRSDVILLKCILSMFRYDKYKFYVHNLGKFDVVYILSLVLRVNKNLKDSSKEVLFIVNPLLRNDTIIRLEIKLSKDKLKSINNFKGDIQEMFVDHTETPKEKVIQRFNKITFIDSYNILTRSLTQLAKDFELPIGKTHFPYSFVNKENFDYVGNTPAISFYKKISHKEYKNLVQSHWNLRSETLSYLENDLVLLEKILNVFSLKLWNGYSVNLTEGLTMTRLALNIFLKHFYQLNNIQEESKEKIGVIDQLEIFLFIKEGYYGGITEVYRPYGENLSYIDVNSLYPYAAKNPMPGLNIEYLESFSDEGLNLNELFGMFYAEVDTTNSSIPYLGLLPVHDKIGGMTLPVGKFSGTWTTLELQFAQKHGYIIKVIKGYNFNKVYNVFDDYVDSLYDKKNNSKGSDKTIYKSLLNNLLGRFGLNIMKPITKLLNYSEYESITSSRRTSSYTHQITEDDILLTYNPNIDKEICLEHGVDYLALFKQELRKQDNDHKEINFFQDVNVAISAFVNSYARIFMNEKKIEILKNGGHIYYSDTDSLVFDGHIPHEWIGKNLGQFKLEHNVKEGYFISNKTYCLIDNNDKIIIKCKGVDTSELTVNDFKDLLSEKNIKTMKTSSNISWKLGSVNIDNKKVELSHDAFKKRLKVKNKGIWIDTKPIPFDYFDK